MTYLARAARMVPAPRTSQFAASARQHGVAMIPTKTRVSRPGCMQTAAWHGLALDCKPVLPSRSAACGTS
eukprot:10888101-Heterocapsa_arctica.AAC.1